MKKITLFLFASFFFLSPIAVWAIAIFALVTLVAMALRQPTKRALSLIGLFIYTVFGMIVPSAIIMSRQRFGSESERAAYIALMSVMFATAAWLFGWMVKARPSIRVERRASSGAKTGGIC